MSYLLKINTKEISVFSFYEELTIADVDFFFF